MANLDSQGDVTIEFIGGGPLDGVFTFPSDGNSPPVADDARLAWGFYHLTGGEVGKAAMGISPAVLYLLTTRGRRDVERCGPKAHRYRVIERREENGRLLIRAKAFEEPKPQSA